MLTKTGSAFLRKQAILTSWGKLPQDVMLVGKKLLPAKKRIYSANKNTGRFLARVGSRVGAAADFIGKGIVNHPKYVIPAIAGVGAAAYKMNDLPAYEARIEHPNSGVTTMSPFQYTLKFSDPSYRKYYE